MKEVDVLGIKVCVESYDNFLNEVMEKAKKKHFAGIAPLAVHPLVLASFNSEYRQELGKLDQKLPDSFWHLWGVNFLYGLGLKKQFYGPSVMEDLAKRAKKEGLSVFLYGGKDRLVLGKMERWFAGLGEGDGKIYKFPASFSIGEEELINLARKINDLGPGILFVGVGTPLQHKILSQLRGKIRVPVVGVGAAFNLLTGVERQAPEYLRNVGFEWAYRTFQNPKRLALRYIFCLLYFPLIFRQKFKMIYSSLLTDKKL